jgi:hypothetical protein
MAVPGTAFCGGLHVVLVMSVGAGVVLPELSPPQAVSDSETKLPSVTRASRTAICLLLMQRHLGLCHLIEDIIITRAL